MQRRRSRARKVGLLRSTWRQTTDVFVTEGIGLCQRRGGSIEIIRPGDRMLFEADEEHGESGVSRRVKLGLPS
jgi:hypothetical protein